MIKFLAVDLETTSLDPRAGEILEIAVVPLDKNLELAGQTYHSVINPTINNPLWKPTDCDAFVQEMHTANGLFRECLESTNTLLDFKDYLDCLGLDEKGGLRKIHLLGSSIEFDREWLRVKLPELNFNHQLCNVSSLKLLFPIETPFGTSESNHRATDDIKYSIAVARMYLNRLNK